MKSVLERLSSLDLSRGREGRRRNNLSPTVTQREEQPSLHLPTATTQQAPPPRPARIELLAPPASFVPGDASDILSHRDLAQIDAGLPEMCQGYSWRLLFSLGKHGASFMTFYRRVKSIQPTVLAIRTTDGEVFGGFTTTPWAVSMTAQGPAYYGTGSAFLYKIEQLLDAAAGGGAGPEEEQEGRIRQEEERAQASKAAASRVNFYPWTRENTYYMLSTPGSIGMGGGAGEFGLFIGENFESGSSGRSETFHNSPLSSLGKHFDILSFECWTLEQPAIALFREQSLQAQHQHGLPLPRAGLHHRAMSLDPRYGTGHEVDSPYKSLYESFDEEIVSQQQGGSTRFLGRSRSLGAATLAAALNNSGDEWID